MIGSSMNFPSGGGGGAFRALLNTAMKGWTKQLRLAVL